MWKRLEKGEKGHLTFPVLNTFRSTAQVHALNSHHIEKPFIVRVSASSVMT